MTDEEMQSHYQRLIEIMQISDSGDRNKAIIQLRYTLGASYCGKDPGSIGERDSQNIAAIHQALQTASMISMCKTAGNSYEMGKQAMNKATATWWTAAAIAFLSMVAAWVAALRT